MALTSIRAAAAPSFLTAVSRAAGMALTKVLANEGAKDNVLKDPIYVGEPTAPITPPIPSGPITPPISAPVSPTSGGSSSGGGCSAFGFAPLALLLLAPLALRRKRG